MKKQPFLNTYINNVDMTEAIQMIESLVSEKKKSYVVPINVDIITKVESDTYIKKIIDGAEMVLVDGKPLIWISKLYKNPIKEKVSGSDIVPLLCEMACRRGYSLFILGGRDGIADQAGKNLKQKLPGIQIVGTYAPPYGFENNQDEQDKINEMISAVHPDLLIVCFGCPKQEKFIYENYQKYDAIVSIGAGATVDFLAGSIKRAPVWMSECGLEWFYRFLQEPKRMFKRYFIDDVQILKLVWKYR